LAETLSKRGGPDIPWGLERVLKRKKRITDSTEEKRKHRDWLKRRMP
jgi:hypothetical protein